MEKQLLAEIKMCSDNSTTTSQLMIEREFRFFLLKLLDEPEKFNDFINTVTPYFLSEMSKVVPQNSRELVFQRLLRVFTEGENPLSIKTPLTNEERRSFLLSLIPESMPKVRNQLSSMKNIPIDMFQSFAETFMYFQNLEEENESLSSEVKKLISLKKNKDVVVENFITTARSLPRKLDRFSATTTPRTISSRTVRPVKQGTSKVMHFGGPLQARDLSAKRPESARRKKGFFEPSVCKVRNEIDIRTIRNKSLDELNEMLDAREKEVNKNKKESETLKKRIADVRRDVIVLEDEVSFIENQASLLEQKTRDIAISEIKEKEENDLLLTRRKKAANKVTQELKDAIATNRELKRQLEELKDF